MAKVAKPRIVKLPVKKTAVEKPTAIKKVKTEKSVAVKKTPIKKAIIKAKPPEVVQISISEIAVGTETVSAKRGRPAGVNHKPCPFCGEPCVRKGVRDYKNAGGAAARFHCCVSESGCKRYHLRNKETGDIIDIPPDQRRKQLTTCGKKRISVIDITQVLEASEEVLTYLKMDENNEALISLFEPTINNLRDKLPPHVQPSIVQIQDPLAAAVAYFDIEQEVAADSEWPSLEQLNKIMNGNISGLDATGKRHVQTAMEQLLWIFAIVEAAKTKITEETEMQPA